MFVPNKEQSKVCYEKANRHGIKSSIVMFITHNRTAASNSLGPVSSQILDQHQITIKSSIQFATVVVERHFPPFSVSRLTLLSDKSQDCRYRRKKNTLSKLREEERRVVVIAEPRVSGFFFDRFPIGNYFSSIPQQRQSAAPMPSCPQCSKNTDQYAKFTHVPGIL